MDRPRAGPDLGLPGPRAAGRARRRGGPGRDQRLGRRRPAAVVLHPAQGRRVHGVRLLDLLRGPRRRGEPGRPPQARLASRAGSPRSGAGPGRRTGAILYNRASADPDGKPWSERKALVWWDEAAGQWTGHDVADFVADRPPSYRPADGRHRRGRDLRRRPVHHAGRRQGLAVRARRAGRRPAARALRAAGVPVPQPAVRPAAQPGPGDHQAPAEPAPAGRRPSRAPTCSPTWPPPTGSPSTTPRAACPGRCPTCRSCSRSSSARSRRSWPPSGGWRTWAGPRSSPRGPRSRPGSWSPSGCGPSRCRAGRCTRSGCPTTGAPTGISTGDSANDLAHLALDPNVHIQEVKALACDIRPGRRPRGPALRRAGARVPAAGGHHRRHRHGGVR